MKKNLIFSLFFPLLLKSQERKSILFVKEYYRCQNCKISFILNGYLPRGIQGVKNPYLKNELRMIYIVYGSSLFDSVDSIYNSKCKYYDKHSWVEIPKKSKSICVDFLIKDSSVSIIP
jgi:hypothetical protein